MPEFEYSDYGNYYSLAPDLRAMVQLMRLANAIVTVRRHYPQAASFDLMASDQNTYGFKVHNVTFADGTEADFPYLDGFEDDVNEHVNDLDWNGVVGEDQSGYATVEITDERIAALAAEIQTAQAKADKRIAALAEQVQQAPANA